MNDGTHFPAFNGRGHRRRKVVNMPAVGRYQMDPYERRALELITEVGKFLDAETARQQRRAAAQAEGWSGGEPGE